MPRCALPTTPFEAVLPVIPGAGSIYCSNNKLLPHASRVTANKSYTVSPVTPALGAVTGDTGGNGQAVTIREGNKFIKYNNITNSVTSTQALQLKLRRMGGIRHATVLPGNICSHHALWMEEKTMQARRSIYLQAMAVLHRVCHPANVANKFVFTEKMLPRYANRAIAYILQ